MVPGDSVIACAACGMRPADPMNHPYLACLAYKGVLRTVSDPTAAAKIVDTNLGAVQQRAIEKHLERAKEEQKV